MDHVGELLQLAQAELETRARAAFDVGDWQTGQLGEQLAEVADYLRRVALLTASDHYRAEKASVLLGCVIALECLALEGYAGWPEDDSPAGKALADAAQVLKSTSQAVLKVMWATAAGALDGSPAPAVYTSTAREAQQVAHATKVWADALAARAVPDEEPW